MPILFHSSGRPDYALCWLLVFVAGLCGLPGCKKKVRSLRHIEAETRSLPGLYLTADTNREVIAPVNLGVFVDEETGELCFPAYECKNPDCPGEPKGDRPYLFIHRDVLVKVGPDGEILYEDLPEEADPEEYYRSRGSYWVPTCPACMQNRNLAQETEEERRKYRLWVKPYELPDALRQRQELEREYQRRQQELYGDP